MAAELRFVLDDREALAREHAQNLRHGRALVPKVCAFERLEPVKLVLERAWDGAEFGLDATVVMILADGPVAGTAVEIAWAEGEREALERFVACESASPLEELPTLDEDFAASPGATVSGERDAFDPDEEPGTDESGDDESGDDASRPADPKIVRIRKLSAVERMRLARDGALEDRVLLERCFSKAVWEDLLRNPGISLPEVARIANKGTAPRVLIEQIVDNPAWSRQSIVRRALLGNPRTSADGIGKLLRGLPKAELKLLANSTAFPMAVRIQAKKLITD